MVLPDPVDHHPGRQRVGRIDDPARKAARRSASFARGSRTIAGETAATAVGRTSGPFLVGSPRTSKMGRTRLAKAAGVDLDRRTKLRKPLA